MNGMNCAYTSLHEVVRVPEMVYTNQLVAELIVGNDQHSIQPDADFEISLPMEEITKVIDECLDFTSDDVGSWKKLHKKLIKVLVKDLAGLAISAPDEASRARKIVAAMRKVVKELFEVCELHLGISECLLVHMKEWVFYFVIGLTAAISACSKGTSRDPLF